MTVWSREIGLPMAVALALSTACSSVDSDESPEENDEDHWGYSGMEGPEFWGQLSEEYATCDEGEEQSPVDFTSDLAPSSMAELAFDFADSPARLVDNGHTIVVELENEENELLISGEPYTLLQFHFHAPSEHRVEGDAFALEMHFVHQSSDGDLAVVGVFFEEGDDNDALAEVFSKMGEGSEEGLALDDPIDLMALIPDDSDGWRYDGSLTTPPCSEGVKWNVFATPVSASAEQIDEFIDLHPDSYRPVQDNTDIEDQLGAGGSDS